MGQIGTAESIASEIARLRQQGKRIVTTNGCFDLLHVGHLRYLQAARKHGDCLIVALNDDASVKQLKGTKRPIVSQQERAELLAGLQCVNYVFLFSESSPEQHIVALKPDVHVKGGQYCENTLPEAPAFKAAGIEMAFIPIVEGRSTSELIERILNLYAPDVALT